MMFLPHSEELLGGGSGSLIFFSNDKRLLIKTISKGDFEAFLSIQNDYFEHFRNNPMSLLARIYGLYEINVEEQDAVRLIVMENVIRSANKSEHLLAIFDLKGSRSDRFVEGIKSSPSATLKDLNLIMLN